MLMRFPYLIMLFAIFSFQSCSNSAAQKDNTINSITATTNGFAVVELFTSEGCSSCPPADELANSIEEEALKNNQNIFVLSEHVDYWNHLGWTDPYSKKFFSDRQKWYAGFLNDEGIYTPQMVVNGATSFVGSEKDKAAKSINNALSSTNGTGNLKLSEVDFGTLSFSYTLSQIKNGEVLHVALIEKNLTSNVLKGENKGRTLHHNNVVRDWITIDKPAESGPIQFNTTNIQIDRDKFEVVAFVQDKMNGAISAATILK
jgi:hypothetical protein